eukprot:403355900
MNSNTFNNSTNQSQMNQKNFSFSMNPNQTQQLLKQGIQQQFNQIQQQSSNFKQNQMSKNNEYDRISEISNSQSQTINHNNTYNQNQNVFNSSIGNTQDYQNNDQSSILVNEEEDSQLQEPLSQNKSRGINQRISLTNQYQQNQKSNHNRSQDSQVSQISPNRNQNRISLNNSNNITQKKLKTDFNINRQQTFDQNTEKRYFQENQQQQQYLNQNKQRSNNITITSQNQGVFDDESYRSISIQQDEQNSPIVKIERNNRSIFSELTDKKLKDQSPSQQQQQQDASYQGFLNESKDVEQNCQQYVNEDLEPLQLQMPISRQQNMRPIILSNIPFMSRPSLQDGQRTLTKNKSRINQRKDKDKIALNFSLFPQARIKSSQLVFRRNRVNTNQDSQLSNNQNLQEYFSNLRHRHSNSEQRSKTVIAQESYLKKSLQNNKIYAAQAQDFNTNYQPSNIDIINTMASTQTSHFYQRAKSQNGQRPQTSSKLQYLRPSILDIDYQSQQVLQTEQDSIQTATNQNQIYGVVGVQQNYTFDFNNQVSQQDAQSLSFLSRPETAATIQSRGKKAFNLLQSMQKANSIKNRDLDIIDEQDINQNQVEAEPLDLKQAFYELRHRQEQQEMIDSIDKKDLSLIDKMQSRHQYQQFRITKSIQPKNLLFSKSKEATNKSLNMSRNPYKNEEILQDQVSYRLQKKLNKTFLFKKQSQNGNDEKLYSKLNDILHSNDDQNKSFQRINEVQQIKDKLDLIKTEFLNNKFNSRTKSMGGNRPSTSSSSYQNRTLSKVLTTSNKMEPMSLGPFTKTEKQVKQLQKRDDLEQIHGYGHVGSPFDHPYYQWMDGLRKSNKSIQKQEIVEIQKTKEEMQYQRYLSEVNSLNLVKDYLAENKDSLSQENKSKLINKILDEQRRLKKLEKSIRKSAV